MKEVFMSKLSNIYEAKMTPSEAFSILGVTSGITADGLKKVYRQLSNKHHPDIGGSVEKQQEINQAYEVAKKNINAVSFKQDWEALRQKSREANKRNAIRFFNDLNMKFRPADFQSYFENVFSKPFTYTEERYPKDVDKNTGLGVGTQLTFSDKDNDTVIDLRISANLSNMSRETKQLAGDSDVSYDLWTDIVIFHNNKKNKLKRSDWQSTNSHKVLKDPQELFPPAKMKTIALGTKSKKAKFTKKDATLFVNKKIGGRPFNDSTVVDITDDSGFVIDRNVFMRTPMWTIRGMYKTEKKHSIKYDMKNRFDTASLPETEDALIKLKNAVDSFRKHKDSKKFGKELQGIKPIK
jgi:curved DNA-binding protein CbpA